VRTRISTPILQPSPGEVPVDGVKALKGHDLVATQKALEGIKVRIYHLYVFCILFVSEKKT
jgi:hypothetical protein